MKPVRKFYLMSIFQRLSCIAAIKQMALKIILFVGRVKRHMSILYQNKTINNNNQNPYNEPQQPKATVSFSSKKQRFNHHIDQSPGPGSYESRTSNFTLHQYHLPKDSSAVNSVKKEHQWIWGSDRTSYIQNKNISSGVIGPGAYNVTGLGLGMGNTNWGKSERFAINHQKKTSSHAPGPGAYQNYDPKQIKNTLGSVFRSKSPKTYMEKLFSEASAPQMKKSMEIELFENPETSSKIQQNTSQKSLEKKQLKSSSVFASKIPRFGDNTSNNVNQMVGPGSYDCPELGKQKSKEKLPKIITVKSDERAHKIKRRQPIPQPGPGEYESDGLTIERQLTKKSQIPIGRSERFHEKIDERPGPGHYMQNKYQFAAEMEKSRKLSPQKPSFNSSSGRSKPELLTKLNPFGSYNVQYFDMQYRMKKKQQHIEKLKIMQVSLPAFNTKAKR